MSFIKEFFRSIARTFGRIVAYIIIGSLIFLLANKYVNAKSSRIRMFSNNNEVLINTTSSPAEYNGYMFRDLINLSNGNMNANNTTYFSFDLGFGIRTTYSFPTINNETNVTMNFSHIYWVDSSDNIHDITDVCNLSAVKKKNIEQGAGSVLWQWNVIGTCSINSTSVLSGFLIEVYFSYTNYNPLYSNRKSAVSINDFDITQNPTEGQQIIDNANKNAQNIINAIENSNSEVVLSIENLDSSIEDLNFSVTDNTPPSDMNFFSDIGLSDDTPISNLILMPITLLNAFNSGVNGTCRPFNLGALYGSELIMPCINIENKLGSNLWNSIDAITSIFIIYELAMLIVSVFNDITSLKDGFNGLYTPKHEGYKPRHSADYERVDD